VRFGLVTLCALLLSSCTPVSVPSSEVVFQSWLSAAAERAAAFERFEAMLDREGVTGVLPSHELWLADRLAPECVVEPFTMPPEAIWPRIVPALRFIRDHVKPVIGDVAVASGYRDVAFNACVEGAPQSAHLSFHALDLLPVDRRVTRARLIETLCPGHARDGPGARIGMGIYQARRFHIDARRFRGWGEDFHAATFPCARL
jgi:hypothetical protein